MIPLLPDSIRGLSMDTMAYSNDEPVKRTGNCRLFFYLVFAERALRWMGARKRIWTCSSQARAWASRWMGCSQRNAVLISICHLQVSQSVMTRSGLSRFI